MIKHSINSKDAIEMTMLPKKGIQRYFVWLCKLNDKLKLQSQLSDKELWKIAKKMT
jgi:G:T-mismatch repair DNA endonuclease (very short patch repair protein)